MIYIHDWAKYDDLIEADIKILTCTSTVITWLNDKTDFPDLRCLPDELQVTQKWPQTPGTLFSAASTR